MSTRRNRKRRKFELRRLQCLGNLSAAISLS